jgi:hypothetical protein
MSETKFTPTYNHRQNYSSVFLKYAISKTVFDEGFLHLLLIFMSTIQKRNKLLEVELL